MRRTFAVCLALSAVLALAVVEPAAAAVVDVAHSAVVHLVHLSPGDLFEPVAGALAISPLLGVRHFGPCFDKDDGAGGGGAPGTLSREDVEAIASEAVKRAAGSGAAPDLSAVARLLADEKEKTATARRETADLRTKLPAEGAVVLTGTEATAYTALRARDGYGDTALVKATADLDASGTALAEVAKLKTQTSQDEAYRAAGLDPAKVRKYLPELDARMDGDGAARKAVLVTKGANGAEVLTPLADALKADHAEILPVLAGTPAATAATARGTFPAIPTTATHAPSGTEDMVGTFLAQQAATARPAAPGTTAAAQA